MKFFSSNISLIILNRKSYPGLYTVYQLVDMQKGWDERPFEEYYTTISRQHIEFPSVTVCPSGKLNGLAKILISIIQQ